MLFCMENKVFAIEYLIWRTSMEEVLEYLSENIKVEIIKALNKNIQGIEEIRLRTNKPIVIK